MSDTTSTQAKKPRKAYLVARREFIENIRTKAFWIGIFVFPIILTLATIVPMWLEGTKDVRRYAVLDESGWLLEAMEERAAMPDLESVFAKVLEWHRAESPKLEELPQSLRAIGAQLELGIGMSAGQPELAELDDQAREDKLIEGFAYAISGISGPQGEQLRAMLPDQVTAELERLAGDIREWYRALPPEEADTFGSRVSKGRYERIAVDTSGDSIDVLATLDEQVDNGELFAYFHIDDDPLSSDGPIGRYVSANLADDSLPNWMERLATDAVRDRRLVDAEVDPAVARWLRESVDFEVRKVGAEEAAGETDVLRQWAPAIFVYLLWISVFSISQMLLTNTIEEKSNRLMEVLLSSVSPLQLMIGKIAGIALTGLAMVVSWVVFFFLAAELLPRIFGSGADLQIDLGAIASDPVYLVSFVAYFILGYLFYAALLVAIGSVCNSLKEAQNLMTPVTILLMIPLFSMVFIVEDPNGALAKAMSFIPPFTPFVMMNRAAGPPALWEYVATTVLMVASIALVMWAAAKVFRIGVLMTGKAPKVGEILRWVRVPVGQVPERKSTTT
ncbi:MAG: ABC transporter permease [Acidobacteriota bacterium]